MGTVKNISATILFAIYVFSATAVRELFKLPLLVEHYYEHCKEDKAIGLTQFLFMHYCQENGTDNDAKKDDQLPFKSSASITTSFISILPPSGSGLLVKPGVVTNKLFGFYNNVSLPSQYLDTIWQPPRYC